MKNIMILNHTTSSVAILALLDLLKDNGVRPEDITKRTEIENHLLDFSDIRIPLSKMKKLWEFAIDISGDPALGLHLRDQYGRDFKHFVISIVKNSKTLLEAAHHWCRYARVICESDRILIHEEENNYRVVYSNLDPDFQCTSMTEHDTAQAVKYARLFSGISFNPVKVHFAHEKPDYAKEYEKIFKCPVRFESDDNSIIFKKKDLQQPIISRDPHLQAVLKKHADAVIKQLSETETIKSRVELFIVKNLAMGNLDIEKTAVSLNMSRSTLQRKLKQEGATFSSLLENTRKSILLTHLKQNMDATQIAYHLGFADPSTFQHAFKRWYGKSPGEFRKELHSYC